MRRLALAGLVLTSTALAQEPPSKPTDPRSGRITGIVVTDGGLPVAGAIVTVAGLPGESPVSVASNTDGTFEVRAISPGTHRFLATKPGFLLQSAAVTGGARITSLRLRADEHARVTLTLTKAGVITGRVVDEFGEPVDRLEVYALRYARGIDGRRSLMRAGDADLTDDRGEFRVFGLPPDDYLVMAVTAPTSDPNAVGRSLGPLGPFTTLPTYFPGTHDVADAMTVTLGTGQEIAASFTWRPARPFRVSGVVVSARPLVAPMIALATPTVTGSSTFVAPNGSFVIEGVAPGDYTLSVREGRGLTSLPVSVRDADVTGLVVTMKTAVAIRGRVTLDGARAGAAITLRFMSGDGGDLTALIIGDMATVQPDGQFALESTASHVTVEAPPGWSVSAVTVDGVDVMASGIDLSDRTSVDGVHVRLTNRLTRVTGRVTLDRGEPLDNAVVMLLRLESGPAPLRSVMRTLRTDGEGRFETEGLRRGSYVVAAVDTVDLPITDDEYLERLRAHGRRFSLDDGQAVTLDMTPSEALR